VESAVYFAIGEALTNAVRHSGGTRLGICRSWSDGALRAMVTDNGHGGADESGGSGLAGLRRRLASFDGELNVDSPAGGPTLVAMEVPCELSSPKTTSC
jgi:signal transduction histidine kinase